jgi:hypothetical protein
MTKKEKLGWLAATVGSGIMALLNPDTVESFIKQFGDASQNQFAKNIFIFSLAAVIHSGRMKKEIRSNFQMLTDAIERATAALRKDLSNQQLIIDDLRGRVQTLESNNPNK